MGLPVKPEVAKVRAIRAWLEGKRKHGIEPNADEIWDRIEKTWPWSTHEQKEAIFQAAK